MPDKLPIHGPNRLPKLVYRMSEPQKVSIDLKEAEECLVSSLLGEKEVLEYFTILTKLKKEHEQRVYQLAVKLSTLQRRLNSLQRKRILRESPEEKQVRLLMRDTGMTENEIRQGLDIVKKAQKLT